MRPLMGVKGAESFHIAVVAVGFGADLVFDIGREMVETVGAIVTGDVGVDSEASRVFERDDGAWDAVVGFVENHAGKIAGRARLLGLLLSGLSNI